MFYLFRSQLTCRAFCTVRSHAALFAAAATAKPMITGPLAIARLHSIKPPFLQSPSSYSKCWRRLSVGWLNDARATAQIPFTHTHERSHSPGAMRPLNRRRVVLAAAVSETRSVCFRVLLFMHRRSTLSSEDNTKNMYN